MIIMTSFAKKIDHLKYSTKAFLTGKVVGILRLSQQQRNPRRGLAFFLKINAERIATLIPNKSRKLKESLAAQRVSIIKVQLNAK